MTEEQPITGKEAERLFDQEPEKIEQAHADIAAGRTFPLSELEQRRRVDAASRSTEEVRAGR